MSENPWWSRPGVPGGASMAPHQPAPPPPEMPPAQPTVGRRTLAEVTAVHDNIRYAVASHGYELDEWAQGLYAAYTWVLGKAPTAPVTGRAAHGIPDRQQLREEDEAAERELRQGPRRRYANGVQHAVMWVRGETSDQPWPMWE